MLAMQLNGYGFSMGLGADGTPATTTPTAPAPVTPTTTTPPPPTQKEDKDLVSKGITMAAISGITTTAVFAGAFGLARTERVWTPALFLGALTLLTGLVNTAMVKKEAEKKGAFYDAIRWY